jgi:hypothetical protein
VLPACLRIGRESARCLQLPEPRPPWYSSCPKRKLEGFLPISTKPSQTRGTDWQSGSSGFGTELPPPLQHLEALGCEAGTPACYREGKWAHHGHCPSHCGGAPGSPSAVSPAQTILGCRRRRGLVLRQLSNLESLQDLSRSRPDTHALLLCKGRAGEWCDDLDFYIWAYGNEWSVEADARCLFCRWAQPLAMLRRISLFSADSQARVPPIILR